MTHAPFFNYARRSASAPTNDRSQPHRRWQSLLSLMEHDRPYLDTQLMQREIADRLGVSCRTLSRLISQHRSDNFNGFVNEYRLREACRLLRDPRYDRLSVESIATKSGFNSRGVFYRAFKAQIGVSPAVYRADN